MTTINTADVLYVALELGYDKRLLASATQAAEKPRFRTVPARNLAAFQEEIAKAKTRFQLPAEAPVRICYEAGRDGFWLHRALTALGINNIVVDASSIEVNRRQKQVKRAIRWMWPSWSTCCAGPREGLASEREFDGPASRPAGGSVRSIRSKSEA